MRSAIRSGLEPLQHARAFERDYQRENLNRMLHIAGILYLFEWLIFFNHHLFLDTGTPILAFQLYNSLLLPLLFVAWKRFDRLSMHWWKVLLYLYMGGVVMFGAFLVYWTRNRVDLLHVFLMMLLCAGTLIFIPPVESLVALMVPVGLFVAGLFRFGYPMETLRIYVVNTVLFTLVIWFLSVYMFVQKMKDLQMKKQMNDTNQLLERKILMDQMTGLYTHEAIFDMLAMEMEAAQLHRAELTLMLLDIDDFKRLNDLHGHYFGDQVFKALSRGIRQAIRQQDHAGRYGGDEFMLLLPRTDVAGAEQLYQRIMEVLATARDLQGVRVTLSAGITACRNESIEELVKLADRRLYMAKHSGKAMSVSADAV